MSDDDVPELHVPDDLRGGIWANHVLVTPNEDEAELLRSELDSQDDAAN